MLPLGLHGGSGIDTQHWVFCSHDAARMLDNVESKSRAVLGWSFGALMLLAAAAGTASLIAFANIRTREVDLRARYDARTALLERIRRGILATGPEAETETRSAAADYGDANLRVEVDLYWKTVNLKLDVAATRPRTAALDSYFERTLAARRESARRVAVEVEAALLREREITEAAHAPMYRRFQWSFGAIVAMALAAGAGVALVAVRRVVRLERESRALAAQVVRAQEEERRRIARELHDEVGQSLSRMLLDAGDLPIRAQAEATLDAVRRIGLALRPSMLDDLGLVAALEWQAREAGNRSGLDIRVDAEDSAGELPEQHSTCIYRVAQEALQNCVRHAKASRVTIGLQRVNGTVALEVKDDGRGFHPTRARGMGLLGMEERVAQLGGRLRVKSAPGQGTSVTAEIPV